MAKDGLGDRCKGYEAADAGRRAVRGQPLIARLDGRAFHTFTRDLKRPYEHGMSIAMIETARYLLDEMNALVGYTQSDEITLAWYEAADLFVHPTLYEGSSLVTLEAMAHRRACVVTNAGGLPDKVKNGINGWVVAAGDASALAAAISGALENPQRLAEMGNAGREIVEAEFSWTAAADKTLSLYAELLTRGAAAR